MVLILDTEPKDQPHWLTPLRQEPVSDPMVEAAKDQVERWIKDGRKVTIVSVN